MSVRSASPRLANELGDGDGRGCRIARGGTLHVDADRYMPVAGKIQDGFQAGNSQTREFGTEPSSRIQPLQLVPGELRGSPARRLSIAPGFHASSRGDHRDSSAHHPRSARRPGRSPGQTSPAYFPERCADWPRWAMTRGRELRRHGLMAGSFTAISFFGEQSTAVGPRGVGLALSSGPIGASIGTERREDRTDGGARRARTPRARVISPRSETGAAAPTEWFDPQHVPDSTRSKMNKPAPDFFEGGVLGNGGLGSDRLYAARRGRPLLRP